MERNKLNELLDKLNARDLSPARRPWSALATATLRRRPRPMPPTGRRAAIDLITRTAVQAIMKQLNAAGLLQAFLIFGLLLGGCATRNVNPTHAKANTGYAGFHADSSSDLSWDVARFDERSQTFMQLKGQQAQAEAKEPR